MSQPPIHGTHASPAAAAAAPPSGDRASAGGALIWLLVSLLLPADVAGGPMIARLFLLAPLVLVPLALPLAGPVGVGWPTVAVRWAVRLQPWGALLATLSFLLPASLLAAGLAAGWLLVAGLVALAGAGRLLTASGRPGAADGVRAAGMLLLPVGAAWLCFARLDIAPLGFGNPIALLTAVHFHYTGFVAPVIAGQVGQWLAARHHRAQPLFTWLAAGLIAGTPVVAVGFTVGSVSIQLAGALILALSLWGLAALILGAVVPVLASRLAGGLLVVAALAVSVAMLLAVGYAAQPLAGFLGLSIPLMAATHGVLNALGFGLCGLLGWRLAGRGG